MYFFSPAVSAKSTFANWRVRRTSDLTRGHFADALRAFSRLDRDLFEVDDETYRSIRTWTTSWRERLLMRGIEHERGSGPDRADDSGFDISDF
jgi:hypothetical protein